jgi:hypothetical protein
VSDNFSKTGRPLRVEIARLEDKLAEALKRATFIGLTTEEAKECAYCHAELTKLTKQLLSELPESNPAPNPVPRATLPRSTREVRGDEESLTWWGLIGAFAKV